MSRQAGSITVRELDASAHASVHIGPKNRQQYSANETNSYGQVSTVYNIRYDVQVHHHHHRGRFSVTPGPSGPSCPLPPSPIKRAQSAPPVLTGRYSSEVEDQEDLPEVESSDEELIAMLKRVAPTGNDMNTIQSFAGLVDRASQ
nr:hypothetical protein B0A51_00777 [Rachicladosporium sp. CCFEE 5018]